MLGDFFSASPVFNLFLVIIAKEDLFPSLVLGRILASLANWGKCLGQWSRSKLSQGRSGCLAGTPTQGEKVVPCARTPLSAAMGRIRSRDSHSTSPASVYQPWHVETAKDCALKAPVREESCFILEKHFSLLHAECHSLALQHPNQPGCRLGRLRTPLHLSFRVRLALLPQ